MISSNDLPSRDLSRAASPLFSRARALLSNATPRPYGWVVALALLTGCASDLPQAAPAPWPVRVETAAPSQVEDSDELVATIRSRESTDIRAQVSGHVTEIVARAGTDVEAGQVLLRIDATPQLAAVGRARAATSTAAAGVPRAEAEIAVLRAEHEARDADVAYAQAQLERASALVSRGAASQEEHDRASSALRVAEAQAGAVAARLDAAQAQLASVRSLVAESASSLREGRAHLDHYTVVAPVAGRLGDIPVHVGDLVDPSTLLTTLEGRGGLELSVHIPVELAPRLREGLEVHAVTSTGEVLARTEVAFVSPRVDPITQTVLVTGPLEPGGALRVGQLTRARVIWDRHDGVTVPTTAVLRVNTQPFLFVVRDGEPLTVAQRPIRIGPLHQQRYVVVDGLEAGDRVVVAGIQRLSDGSAVRVETPSDVARAGTPAPGEG